MSTNKAGTRPDGTPTCWTFTEIVFDLFHCLGEGLATDGKSWILEGEFRAAPKKKSK